ncbi:ParA family protein [Coraliomargarita akajimensis]|uniref:Cobyrinic acid ac-diamide synthase n=1 Tax=Coraliomargarita akajimensis (strain DSM 45221 / IAM 15411 / JCM 23193 / KCTC 12865 / 04OKA010-24) TaxID=583355 RepID=D5EHN7_CORAD|nr:AAA family ATPase [Coraliomargarita akajimensis]ADE54078.1 Cobyrinic acid ac-diamide synthase [Coraliomargarita akajimensis DSM 45221]
MARKLAFINYKGGVGKTSLIVNVAACLAQKGKRVLLVDLDTQSNSSIWLMRIERWNRINMEKRGSVYSIFDPAEETIKDIIVKDVLRDNQGNPQLPGLDLLPTTFNLIDIENEYKIDPQRPHYLIFNEQMREVEDNYDFILYDCPPNVLNASQNGIFSADELYVPSNPDALSLIGFTLMIEKLLLFYRRSAGFRTPEMGNFARVAGVVFNSIKANVDIGVPKMRMQLRLNQFKKQRLVSNEAKIFNTCIRDATIVRRAVTLGLPVCLVESRDVTDGVGKDYDDLAEEILAHNVASSVSAGSSVASAS